MAESSVVGVLFDWGHVIGDFDHEPAFQEISLYCRKSSQEVGEMIGSSSELGPEHETGKISSKEFFRRARRLLDIDAIDLSNERFAVIWRLTPFAKPEMDPVFARMRPDIPRAVVSNTDPIHWEKIKRTVTMREFFRDAKMHVLSFDVGTKKPHKDMYEEGIRRIMSTAPGQGRILFIDDIQANVDAAKELGLEAEVYDNTKMPPETLAEILSSYSLLK